MEKILEHIKEIEQEMSKEIVTISKNEFLEKSAKAVSEYSSDPMLGVLLAPIISTICYEIFDADKEDGE